MSFRTWFPGLLAFKVLLHGFSIVLLWPCLSHGVPLCQKCLNTILFNHCFMLSGWGASDHILAWKRLYKNLQLQFVQTTAILIHTYYFIVLLSIYFVILKIFNKKSKTHWLWTNTGKINIISINDDTPVYASAI